VGKLFLKKHGLTEGKKRKGVERGRFPHLYISLYNFIIVLKKG